MNSAGRIRTSSHVTRSFLECFFFFTGALGGFTYPNTFCFRNTAKQTAVRNGTSPTVTTSTRTAVSRPCRVLNFLHLNISHFQDVYSFYIWCVKTFRLLDSPLVSLRGRNHYRTKALFSHSRS